MKDDVTGPGKVPVADFYESGNEQSRRSPLHGDDLLSNMTLFSNHFAAIQTKCPLLHFCENELMMGR
jgi:hypothetical protein